MAASTLPLLVFFVSVVCLSVLAQQSIPLGSTLTTSSNSKWTSPNGDFAFGFRAITPGGPYVVAIWFDKISDKTIVWTARRTGLRVEEGSTLSLSQSGLRLFDSQNSVNWSVNKPTSAAEMQNNGNFVLFNGPSQYPTWQSFDHRRYTLLPGQNITASYPMYSKVSDTDYSNGRFQLAIQIDGNLVLQLVEGAGLPNSGVYWSQDNVTKQGTTHNPSTLFFNSRGRLYLVNSTNALVRIFTEGNAGQGEFFRRVTLDTDGILRQSVWNKTETTNSWIVVWQAVDDPCTVTAQCGFNGVCRLNNSKVADCFCPPGYIPIDAVDGFNGCREVENSCTANNNANMSMMEMNNTDWFNSNDYSRLTFVTDIQCKQVCMEDSLCSVVVYDVNELVCSKKQNPLVNGRQGANITTTGFVKFCEGQPKQKKGKAVVVILIALGCFCAALVATGLVIWLRGCAPKFEAMEIDGGLKAFGYREIEAATGGFAEELGRGGFGVVYKGSLSDGRSIAAKKLDKLERELDRGEKEFRTEMRLIGNSHHKNLVQLYGFCHEANHRILVYEFMSNGSLDRLLFHGGFLDWKLRVRIAMGIARGILYLHEECRTQIIHCDIKPQNILLDENYNSKIADFGMAKLMRAEQTRTVTEPRGTRGYIAPEWIKNQPITERVDVYSFGVMLLEIICCRKNLDTSVPEEEVILSEWVYDCLKNSRIESLVEIQQEEGERIDVEQLERMVMVGIWCIQEDPVLRPSIRNVAGMLEGTIHVQLPPCPRIFVELPSPECSVSSSSILIQ